MEQAILALTPSIPRGLPRAGTAARRWMPQEPDWYDTAPTLPDAQAGFGLVHTILDRMHFGVAVVGPQWQLWFVNQAALRECARHPVLRIDQDRLVALEPPHHDDLTRALAAARAGRWSLVQLEYGDDRMTLAVLPLWPNAICDDAPALMVFGLRNHSKALAIEFYAQSCGLTPAEGRVLRALGEGLHPKEIALQHFVAVSTVRTQLGSIREKTGARGIAELMRTLDSLPPIMPAMLQGPSGSLSAAM